MKQRGSFSTVTACVAALIVALMVSAAQAAEVGKAVVRSIRGHAQVMEGANWLELNVGQTLRPGSTIRTANDSQVDLFMDQNGPVVRLTENTELGIDKLNFEATGVDTVIETQLDAEVNSLRGAPTAALTVEEPIRIFVSPLAGENSSIKR